MGWLMSIFVGAAQWLVIAICSFFIDQLIVPLTISPNKFTALFGKGFYAFQEVFIGFGIFLCLLIFIWSLIRGFSDPMGISVPKLIMRFVASIFLTVYITGILSAIVGYGQNVTFFDDFSLKTLWYDLKITVDGTEPEEIDAFDTSSILNVAGGTNLFLNSMSDEDNEHSMAKAIKDDMEASSKNLTILDSWIDFSSVPATIVSIIGLFTVCFGLIKYLYEIVERYVMLWVQIFIAPLAASTYADPELDTLKKYLEMVFSTIFIFFMNIVFLKVIMLAMGNVGFETFSGSGGDATLKDADYQAIFGGNTLLYVVMLYSMIHIAQSLDTWMSSFFLTHKTSGALGADFWRTVTGVSSAINTGLNLSKSKEQTKKAKAETELAKARKQTEKMKQLDMMGKKNGKNQSGANAKSDTQNKGNNQGKGNAQGKGKNQSGANDKSDTQNKGNNQSGANDKSDTQNKGNNQGKGNAQGKGKNGSNGAGKSGSGDSGAMGVAMGVAEGGSAAGGSGDNGTSSNNPGATSGSGQREAEAAADRIGQNLKPEDTGTTASESGKISQEKGDQINSDFNDKIASDPERFGTLDNLTAEGQEAFNAHQQSSMQGLADELASSDNPNEIAGISDRMGQMASNMSTESALDAYSSYGGSDAGKAALGQSVMGNVTGQGSREGLGISSVSGTGSNRSVVANMQGSDVPVLNSKPSSGNYVGLSNGQYMDMSGAVTSGNKNAVNMAAAVQNNGSYGARNITDSSVGGVQKAFGVSQNDAQWLSSSGGNGSLRSVSIGSNGSQVLNYSAASNGAQRQVRIDAVPQSQAQDYMRSNPGARQLENVNNNGTFVRFANDMGEVHNSGTRLNGSNSGGRGSQTSSGRTSTGGGRVVSSRNSSGGRTSNSRGSSGGTRQSSSGRSASDMMNGASRRRRR